MPSCHMTMQAVCAEVVLCHCSTKEAFKKKIGFLGTGPQAERLTDAFLSHGVVMKPEEIHNYASKSDEAMEKLGLKPRSSASEVSISCCCLCIVHLTAGIAGTACIFMHACWPIAISLSRDMQWPHQPIIASTIYIWIVTSLEKGHCTYMLDLDRQ